MRAGVADDQSGQQTGRPARQHASADVGQAVAHAAGGRLHQRRGRRPAGGGPRADTTATTSSPGRGARRPTRALTGWPGSRSRHPSAGAKSSTASSRSRRRPSTSRGTVASATTAARPRHRARSGRRPAPGRPGRRAPDLGERPQRRGLPRPPRTAAEGRATASAGQAPRGPPRRRGRAPGAGAPPRRATAAATARQRQQPARRQHGAASVAAQTRGGAPARSRRSTHVRRPSAAVGSGRGDAVTRSPARPARQDRRPDAGDVVQLVDLAEGALRSRWSTIRWASTGPIPAARPARPRWRCSGSRPPPPPAGAAPAPAAPPRARNADGDLLAVGHDGREVHRRRVGVRQQAAGGLDRVGDPRAGRQRDQPGLAPPGRRPRPPPWRTCRPPRRPVARTASARGRFGAVRRRRNRLQPRAGAATSRAGAAGRRQHGGPQRPGAGPARDRAAARPGARCARCPAGGRGVRRRRTAVGGSSSRLVRRRPRRPARVGVVVRHPARGGEPSASRARSRARMTSASSVRRAGRRTPRTLGAASPTAPRRICGRAAGLWTTGRRAGRRGAA